MPHPLFLLFILLFTSATAAETGSLGRLFHSPEERHALDQLRRDNWPSIEKHSSTANAQHITLDGIVKRNAGKSTAWINGVSHFGDESSQGVQVLGKPVQHGAATLQFSSGKNVNLKVGQTYDVTEKDIQERWNMPATQIIMTRLPKANKTQPH